MKHVFFIILSVLVLFSCEQQKEITLDIPFEGEKIAFYGMISNEPIQKIEVFKTLPVLDSTIRPEVKNLQVVLLKDGKYLTDYLISRNNGETNAEISKNSKYSIVINSELGEFNSNEITPVDILTIQNSKYNLSKDSSTIQLSFSFIVPNDTCYYSYGIQMYNKSNSYFVKEARLNVSSQCSTLKNSEETIIWNDRFRLPVFKNNIQTGVEIPDKICIKLYHVSKEVVRFYEVNKKNNSDFGNQLSNISQLWSNIEGCYGYFGSYAVDSLVLEF